MAYLPHCKSLCIFVKKDEQVAAVSVHCIGFVVLQENPHHDSTCGTKMSGSPTALNLLWHMYMFQLFYVESALLVTGAPAIHYLQCSMYEK